MNPGDKVTIEITATIISCANLDNGADVRWGCDDGSVCFDTALDGGTAMASVQLIIKTPLLQHDPPDITFTYCQDYVDVNTTIHNIGDGTAYQVWALVDFGELSVSNVSNGAVYNASTKRFELTNPIPPGGSYTLTFRLGYDRWCAEDLNSTLVWQKVYRDGCGNEFFPPVELSTLSASDGHTGLSVSKGQAPAVIQIGDQVAYPVTSSYSGPISCGTGSVGTVVVTDTVPMGFTVVNAGNGLWTPGPDGTGGVIVWSYTPPASLNTTIVLQSPDRTRCEEYCETLFTNSIVARATDCCGCVLTASDAQTTAIECEEGVDSSKTAIPGTGARCETIHYINTYDFNNTGVYLNNLKFYEHADHQQQFVPGSLTVTYDGSDITSCIAVIDNTPGSALELDFTGCASEPVNGKTLIIAYDLTLTEASAPACSGTDFYSWSSLDMGTTGSECLADGIIHEATPVSVAPPAMSVSISGLEQIIDKCETKTITITLSQTSTSTAPKDVRLVLSGLNYYCVDPTATICSGNVTPESCTPSLVGDDYVWYFGDAFTASGQSTTLQLNVRKRCSEGTDLVVTAYYDDLCNDDTIYDDTCSVSDSDSPVLLRSGSLLLEKTPEIYYATTNQAQWKIYVTNRGTGSAYNVWIDDVLGADLSYASAVVNNTAGVVITAGQDHEGMAINGVSISVAEILPGERREITLLANVIGCDHLTNDVVTSWGCGGMDCQLPLTDHSIVKIPAPLLVTTNNVSSPVNACDSLTGSIVLQNAGQTTNYNLQATVTLPNGVHYVSGTTRWRLNGGSWNGPDTAYDPSPLVSPLVWTKEQIPALASLNPGDRVDIEYALDSNCAFAGGTVIVSTDYENPCGQVFHVTPSAFTIAFREPVVSITKTRADQPIGCGQLVSWTIEVRNDSGYTLPILWVEDTLGAAFSYDHSVGDAHYSVDNGFSSGQTVTYELRNVPHGGVATLLLYAQADASPCSSDLDNDVSVWWGCGTADGNSSTKPGIDPPDHNLCLSSVAADTDTHTEK
ncbi:MAG: DUF11 domain-containing protein, partial [Synergistales bacterium]|nr:DUF11 domain-containing protein [Synergistales bacterium]